MAESLATADDSVIETNQPESDVRPELSSPQPQTAQQIKIRHEWYQTDPYVFITILLKNAKKEDVQVDFKEKTVSCAVQLGDNPEYKLDLTLAHAVNPSQCVVKTLSSKIELKLKKEEFIHWTSLEATTKQQPAIKHIVPEVPTSKPVYPSSAPVKKDWDKIVSEITKEDPEEKSEGEAAVNQLFQKIYSEGSDEVKKAMNKSFIESGGTVLSTNWKEIGQKKVEVKPPDGMEWKNWDA